ncbi:YozE family protein [Streptococcaceae bacterium ESL0687]|nr:YozE family protein [Streptococcaceae bacterium ESL0687]
MPSFYTYLMAKRGPKEDCDLTILANEVFNDSTFPRHTSDFNEISDYLEREAPFSFNLGKFDEIFDNYLNK